MVIRCGLEDAKPSGVTVAIYPRDDAAVSAINQAKREKSLRSHRRPDMKSEKRMLLDAVGMDWR